MLFEDRLIGYIPFALLTGSLTQNKSHVFIGAPRGNHMKQQRLTLKSDHHSNDNWHLKYPLR